jgi:hypothetical protein
MTDMLCAPLQTVAMFEYVRDDIVVTRTDAIAAGVYQDLQLIELNTQGGQGCV